MLDPTLKYGLTNSIDAELQLTPYESLTTRHFSQTTSASGMGDTVARRAVEAGLILPLTITAPAGFTVTVMSEGDYLKNIDQVGYHIAFDFLVNVSHSLNTRWSVFTEVFTSQPFKTAYPATYTLDEALTCMLTPSLQLDFGGNFGWNRVTPKLQFYGGLSQRL